MNLLIFFLLVSIFIFVSAFICRKLRENGHAERLDAMANAMRKFQTKAAPSLQSFTTRTTRIFNKKSPLSDQVQDKQLDQIATDLKDLTQKIEKMHQKGK